MTATAPTGKVPRTISERRRLSALNIYRSYPIRWVVLLACVLLVSGSHIAWLTFVPVEYKTAQWIGGNYTNEISKIEYFGSISFPISFLFGFIGAYLFDRFGSYVPLMIGGWSLSVAMALRVVASYLTEPDTRYFTILIAQAIGGISISMLSLSPTKIAAVWFDEKQRILANSIITLMLPGGILMAYVISPQILNAFGDNLEGGFQCLNWLYFVWNFAGTLLITIFMRHPGVPPSPASPTSDEKVLPFFTGLLACITNPKYLMLCGTMSAGMGIVSILMVSMPSIMCPWGFDPEWANTYGITILIGSGTLSSMVMAFAVERYGNMVTTMRVLMIGTGVTIFFNAYCLTSEPNNSLMAVSSVLMGIFAYPTLPLAYEISVETTYPVGPATSAGLNWIFSSLAALIMEFIFNPLRKDMPPEYENANKCTTEGQEQVTGYNYQTSLFVLCGIVCFFGAIWMVFFRCPYYRKNIDDKRRANGGIAPKGTWPNVDHYEYSVCGKQLKYTPEPSSEAEPDIFSVDVSVSKGIENATFSE